MQTTHLASGETFAGTAKVARAGAAIYGDYWQGIPLDFHHRLIVGAGYSTLPLNKGYLRYELTPDNFFGVDPGGLASTVTDWISDQPLKGQLMFLYDSAPTANDHSVDSNVGFGNRTGTLQGLFTFATDFDTTYGLSDLSGAGDTTGYNLIPDTPWSLSLVTGATANQNITWRDTGDSLISGTVYVEYCGMKFTSGPGRVMFSALSEASWSLIHFGTDGAAAQDNKQFTDAELERYLDLVYDDKNSPLVLTVFIAPESTTPAIEKAKIDTIIARFLAAWQAVGGSELYTLLIGVYRTTDNDKSIAQQEGFYHSAIANANTFYVSLYGLMGGILWDNTDTGGDQSAWSEMRGWDNIVHNSGTLDMSAADALDGGQLHPADANAAFFFAYIAWEKIQQIEAGAANAGDVNCDGLVNTTDLFLLISEWGPCAGCNSDLDGNGVTDVVDFFMLMANWS